MDNLVTLPLGCDMVALQEFDVPKKEDHSTLPFRWQISQPSWWDDLAITQPWVAPEHPLPNLTTPTLYTTTSPAWYRGLALPHPFITANPSPHKPITPPPLYNTPHSPLDENRVAPPLAHSFVHSQGYTVVKGLLSGGRVWPNMHGPK